jgi:hypothetical protein
MNKTVCAECKVGDCINCSATRQGRRVAAQEDLAKIAVCVCVCFGEWPIDKEDT